MERICAYVLTSPAMFDPRAIAYDLRILNNQWVCRFVL